MYIRHQYPGQLYINDIIEDVINVMDIKYKAIGMNVRSIKRSTIGI